MTGDNQRTQFLPADEADAADAYRAAAGRAAAEALQISADRLRLATEAAAIGTWDFNPTTGELAWDTRCKELFGLPPEAKVDYDTFLAGLHPDDREATDRAVQDALRPDGSGVYNVEYRTIGLEDGVERWIAATGKGLFAPGASTRQADRFIGTVIDISDPTGHIRLHSKFDTYGNLSDQFKMS